MRNLSRRELLAAAGAGATASALSSGLDREPGDADDARQTEADAMDELRPDSGRMPVLFLGHGTPLNAIEDNRWSRAFAALGRELPRPRAVLSVSAHWWTQGSYLTGMPRPRTIHDFRGFPRELHEVRYPAPGSPDLARQVAARLAEAASVTDDWGLDHGTWSVLRHLLPEADVPVVQLSLDARLAPAQHVELARALHTLRGEGVLVLGSGNVTHNLPDAMQRATAGEPTTPDWARAFDREAAQALAERDTDHLVRAWPDGQHGRTAHPHPDHWFPLLYACAATDEHDTITFPIEGFDLGSLSMRAVLWG